jgi:hypothetical protein
MFRGLGRQEKVAPSNLRDVTELAAVELQRACAAATPGHPGTVGGQVCSTGVGQVPTVANHGFVRASG